MEGRDRVALRTGLIGGVVLVYLAMVGMIEAFSDLNLIGAQITLGRVLLALPPLIAAYLTARPRIVAGQLVRPAPLAAATMGAVTGAAAGAVLGLWLLVVEAIGIERVRSIFVAVSPRLIEILTFGLSVGAAVVIHIVGGALLGVIGGIWRSLRYDLRRPLTIGIVVTLLLGLLQRIVPTILDELNVERDWLYSRVTGGLSWLGAAITFAVATGVSAFVIDQRERRRARIGEAGVPERRAVKGIVLLAIALGSIVLPLLAGSIISEILGSVGIFVLIGLGLNIVVGYAGMLHLGFAAFFAIGAYGIALLTGANLVTAFGLVAPRFSADLNFYVALVIVIVVGAVVGALLAAPVLRLRGDYLAIVTLAFGFMVAILVSSNWLKPFTGGPQGLRDVTPAPIFGFSFRDPQHFYYLALACCAVAAYLSWRLAWSRTGRAWNAMREDEQVAEAMGVGTSRYKLLAFAIGSAMGAVGGALFAVKVGTVQPGSFEILVSITALAIVILGGLGSVPGVIVGALVLIGLPGLLSEFEEYRLLIYGAVLVAIMILRPQGLIPNVRRMRELQEEERRQDASQRLYVKGDDADATEVAEESAT
jgi:branched-chain amino acid transport system permease protein